MHHLHRLAPVCQSSFFFILFKPEFFRDEMIFWWKSYFLPDNPVTQKIAPARVFISNQLWTKEPWKNCWKNCEIWFTTQHKKRVGSHTGVKNQFFVRNVFQTKFKLFRGGYNWSQNYFIFLITRVEITTKVLNPKLQLR